MTTAAFYENMSQKDKLYMNLTEFICERMKKFNSDKLPSCSMINTVLGIARQLIIYDGFSVLEICLIPDF